jgi:protoheme IX farnesyltransferase
MALVVTAPSSVGDQPSSPIGAAVPYPRLKELLRWTPLAAAAWYAVALIAEAIARFAQPWGALDGVVEATSISAMVVVLGACMMTWLARRDDALTLLCATLAVVLVALGAVSTALLTALELPTLVDVVGLVLGLLVLGCLVWTATVSARGPARQPYADSAEGELFRRVVDVTVLLVFAVGLSGVTVRAVGASWACQGAFPDCNGLGMLPIGRDPLADIQLYHRLLAYVALALVGWLTIEAFRSQRSVAGVGRASLVLLGGTLAQGALGAVSVTLDNPPLVQVLHLAGAAGTWSAAVVLAVFAHRPALVMDHDEPSSAKRTRARTVAAYVQLTKPRVMSLLLTTTATAMVIAARGMPDLGVFLATLIGGALMSGGAGAINHYVDRDIDPLMGRTAWRPIPSGVISPGRALWFGIGLAILASAVFVAFVNVLACFLAILGLLGYVFIYTLWLKRSTPSNIVIGGAAGAIPPLVGWAAVTNEIGSLTAWYLFAIIFFWTPPHFWALSLLIRKHYERAGVPMLPVVRGEDETRRQIVLYSVLLVVLTLVLSPFGMMGGIYFAAASVLGGLFIVDALRLWRQATPQAARRLYLYSILYLFALFTAMAVDRVVS